MSWRKEALKLKKERVRKILEIDPQLESSIIADRVGCSTLIVAQIAADMGIDRRHANSYLNKEDLKKIKSPVLAPAYNKYNSPKSSKIKS